MAVSAGTTQLLVVGAIRKKTGDDCGSFVQLSNVSNENAHCHHFALH
jgi:hypothetical protein